MDVRAFMGLAAAISISATIFFAFMLDVEAIVCCDETVPFIFVADKGKGIVNAADVVVKVVPSLGRVR